jgi:hypothetical protein
MEIINPDKTCKRGQGVLACGYLAIGPEGTWTCGRTEAVVFSALTRRLENSDYFARGQGAWVECQLKTTSQKEK